MKDMCYVLGPNVFTEQQIIENAEYQESLYKPEYSKDCGHGDYTDPGYLIATNNAGCIVAYRTRSGEWAITKGMQGDYVYGRKED